MQLDHSCVLGWPPGLRQAGSKILTAPSCRITWQFDLIVEASEFSDHFSVRAPLDFGLRAGPVRRNAHPGAVFSK